MDCELIILLSTTKKQLCVQKFQLPNTDFYVRPGIFGRIIVFCVFEIFEGCHSVTLEKFEKFKMANTMASDDRVHHFSDCFSKNFLIFQIIKIIYMSDELESIMQHVACCPACTSVQNLSPNLLCCDSI